MKASIRGQVSKDTKNNEEEQENTCVVQITFARTPLLSI